MVGQEVPSCLSQKSARGGREPDRGVSFDEKWYQFEQTKLDRKCYKLMYLCARLRLSFIHVYAHVPVFMSVTHCVGASFPRVTGSCQPLTWVLGLNPDLLQER